MDVRNATKAKATNDLEVARPGFLSLIVRFIASPLWFPPLAKSMPTVPTGKSSGRRSLWRLTMRGGVEYSPHTADYSAERRDAPVERVSIPPRSRALARSALMQSRRSNATMRYYLLQILYRDRHLLCQSNAESPMGSARPGDNGDSQGPAASRDILMREKS